MRTLIIACPRSATHYIANVLQQAELDVRFESLEGKDGAVSWWWGGTEDYKDFDAVLHQVRDPIKVFSSMGCDSPEMFNRMISQAFPIEYKPFVKTRKDYNLKLYCMLWFYWNGACEWRSNWTYKVETLGNNLNEFNRFFSIPIEEKHLKIKHFQSMKGSDMYIHDLTWGKIEEACGDFFPAIKNMAIKYGYEVK